MTATLLILLSAALHAGWNFIFKRAGGDDAVLSASKLVESAIFLPVMLAYMLADLRAVPSLLLLSAIGGTLVLANYRLLGAAYRRADLSVAYPVARGSVLFFLPLFGLLVFDERLPVQGIVGVAAIAIGVLLQTTQPRHERLDWRGPAFALAAGLATAGYTIWDKRSVLQVPPPAYFATYTVFVTAAYWLTVDRPRTIAAWREHRMASIGIGLGNASSYLLILLALRDGISSYVIGLRQLSIVFGVFLGWQFLGERITPRRSLGVLVLLTGCLLVALRMR